MLYLWCTEWMPLTVSVAAPCPNAYIRINPIKLVLDTYTIMWFNSFALSLAKDVVCVFIFYNL